MKFCKYKNFSVICEDCGFAGGMMCIGCNGSKSKHFADFDDKDRQLARETQAVWFR